MSSESDVKGAAGTALPHESAHLHVCGEARYTDDLPEPKGTLYAAVGMSSQPHARIVAMDLSAVRAAPGVVCVLTAADIPGENNYGPVLHDDPIFAEDEVQFVGQPLFAVIAESAEQARRAARLGVIEYQALPAYLDVDQALAAQSFVLPSERMERGEPAKALAAARHRLQGRFYIGGQEQFYLEGQIAFALPQEDGCVRIYSSTQHPSEVQHLVAHALGVHSKDVVVECRRMGGGFGGKESQPALFAAIAAIAALKTGRAVKFRVDRDDDIILTGKRHDYRVDYDVGFDGEGRIQALEIQYASRCGYSADLSGPVNDRTMMHTDNAYYLPHVGITSHRCKTHTVSNTAFRGFGGPQGMLGIEHVVDEIARFLGKDPLEVRKANFYGVGERDQTPYGMTVEDNILPELVAELEQSSDYQARRRAIAAFNAGSPIVKKGIALTPVKFGISFTATHYNQAGALLHLYQDGTLLLNHGGLEMGQGLHTKVAQVVAREMGVDIDRIRVTATVTDKVPNTSATAASSGSDLNGKAAQDAARKLKAQLSAFAARHFGVEESAVRFERNQVLVGERAFPLQEFARMAYVARTPLSATGFYATPKIGYDRKTWSGRPFYYFAYGAAVSEVAIDTLTGEYKLTRVDILHDVGRSLNPAIDLGQVEGGFVQGMGWLTCEELWWDTQGRLRTHAPSTYKIPVCRDWPEQFNVRLLENAQNREDTIYRSKAVGEPPLMLAISVFLAIKDAVASVAEHRFSPRLDAPATPEAVLRAVEELKARLASAAAARASGAGA
ncbi:MAG TPA: xanthine dehydrogenase molybdopterin binding subunit [Candidatus Competibacteraceae bacterium]|nr:xanthine dehydrogenase molybdopterin binding subunit [Candidatus Competibacteraceae bacterium]